MVQLLLSLHVSLVCLFCFHQFSFFFVLMSCVGFPRVGQGGGGVERVEATSLADQVRLVLGWTLLRRQMLSAVAKRVLL